MQEDNLLSIADYLAEDLIIFLDVDNRDQAIESMIDMLDRAGKLHSRDLFSHAIREREEVMTTAIGMGIAIPHAKLPGYRDFFIAVGIQAKRGIAWNALDRAPVHLVFMIGGPDEDKIRYLRILSNLTHFLKDPEKREKLIKAKMGKQVIDLFSQT